MSAEPKTTRCSRCYAEFSEMELKGASGCPKCGTRSLPMAISMDATIKINVHELRILGIWAENYAVSVDNKNLDNAAHESLKESLNRITDRIATQLPAEIRTPLTLSKEIIELQQGLKAQGHPGDIELHRDGREEIL
jgi:DNA-directed RNA polymerase subunit RPC12/RpoP